MAVSEVNTRLAASGQAGLRARRDQSFRPPAATAFTAIGRALAGIALTGGLAAITTPGPWGAAILGGMAVLFAAYAARTLARHMAVITISDDGITVAGLVRRHIRWSELGSVSLRYFSTRRDGENGWMDLVLRSGTTRLAIESEHPAFAPAARHALSAAARARLALSAATMANARALGIEPDGGRSRP
ncbi:hypothetical protein [Rhodoligotrophos defluvii]|uniref:hypothetical protein n=1 Tax=Rhodoligotrophos defluvii TaxID=2561934 RepID=UPI0010C999EC|nr:hypothetical protein [Rhodoligotrophos defluvii]